MVDIKNKNDRKIFGKLPFEVVDLDEKISQSAFGPSKKWVQVGPKKYCIPDKYKKCGLDIYNFEVRPDDVFLIGYPRSGTTLHCEAIWLIGNDLDYEGAKNDVIDYRFPHIDFCLFSNFDGLSEIAEENSLDDNVKDTAKKLTKLSLKDLADRKGRRFIKSHLPISLMPPHMFEVGAKIIYCARNPRDMLVSYSNVSRFFKSVIDYDIRTILEAHTSNLCWNCPYFEHVKEAWARRNDENFLFLFYEDTMKDKRQAMKKIANFLGKQLSNDQLNCLEDHLSLEKFRDNKAVNCEHLVKLGLADENSQFIGKGKSGGWREHFAGDLEKEVSDWIEENLKDTDLKFPES